MLGFRGPAWSCAAAHARQARIHAGNRASNLTTRAERELRAPWPDRGPCPGSGARSPRCPCRISRASCRRSSRSSGSEVEFMQEFLHGRCTVPGSALRDHGRRPDSDRSVQRDRTSDHRPPLSSPTTFMQLPRGQSVPVLIVGKFYGLCYGTGASMQARQKITRRRSGQPVVQRDGGNGPGRHSNRSRGVAHGVNPLCIPAAQGAPGQGGLFDRS